MRAPQNACRPDRRASDLPEKCKGDTFAAVSSGAFLKMMRMYTRGTPVTGRLLSVLHAHPGRVVPMREIVDFVFDGEEGGPDDAEKELAGFVWTGFGVG